MPGSEKKSTSLHCHLGASGGESLTQSQSGRVGRGTEWAGLPWWLQNSVKNLPANAGDPGSIPGLGRYPGEGNGNLL